MISASSCCFLGKIFRQNLSAPRNDAAFNKTLHGSPLRILYSEIIELDEDYAACRQHILPEVWRLLEPIKGFASVATADELS
jgi:hypothetical protein